MPIQTYVPPGSQGKWSVVKVEVAGIGEAPAGCGLENAPPDIYTALVHESRGIISCDSPLLMDDQRTVVDGAEGHIVVGGLGVGSVVDMLMNVEAVNHITVVEIDPDVIALVAPSYTDRWQRGSVQFECCDILKLNADVFELRPDRVWLDIWDKDHPETLSDRLAAITKWGESCSWVRAAALDRVYEAASRVMRNG